MIESQNLGKQFDDFTSGATYDIVITHEIDYNLELFVNYGVITLIHEFALNIDERGSRLFLDRAAFREVSRQQ